VGRAGWVSETKFGLNRTIADRTDGFFSKLEPENANESFTGGRRRPRLSTTLGFSGPDGEVNGQSPERFRFAESQAPLTPLKSGVTACNYVRFIPHSGTTHYQTFTMLAPRFFF